MTSRDVRFLVVIVTTVRKVAKDFVRVGNAVWQVRSCAVPVSHLTVAVSKLRDWMMRKKTMGSHFTLGRTVPCRPSVRAENHYRVFSTRKKRAILYGVHYDAQ